MERLASVLDLELWRDRRVLLTGHTGFKGAWTALILERLGARVSGIALDPDTTPSLYESLGPWNQLQSTICDIRDREKLSDTIAGIAPEIVIHMAAQPLVRRSYREPVATIETNVIGTTHVLESLRTVPNLTAVLVITSDKVYENDETGAALSEASPLGGHDPYSASKAAVEVLCSAYARSFFVARGVPVATARAGNVIGGGDWASDRLIPDLWRAYTSGRPIELRHPQAVRPWQHVLDPVCGYLLYLQRAIAAPRETPRSLNFGPPAEPVRTVLDIAERFANALEIDPCWTVGDADPHMAEKRFLSIDAALARATLGWRSVLDVDSAIRWTCEWYKAFRDGRDMRVVSNQQIDRYVDLVRQAVVA